MFNDNNLSIEELKKDVDKYDKYIVDLKDYYRYPDPNFFSLVYEKLGIEGVIDVLDSIKKDPKMFSPDDEDVLEVMLDVLTNDDDLNTVNKNGDSLLHVWHAPALIATIEEITGFRGDKNLKNNKGQTPLEVFVSTSAVWTDLYPEGPLGYLILSDYDKQIDFENKHENVYREYGHPCYPVDSMEFYDKLKAYLECGAGRGGEALSFLLSPNKIWNYHKSTKNQDVRDAVNYIVNSMELILRGGIDPTDPTPEFGRICQKYARGKIPKNSLLLTPALKKLAEYGANINVPIVTELEFGHGDCNVPAVTVLPKKLQKELCETEICDIVIYRRSSEETDDFDIETYER